MTVAAAGAVGRAAAGGTAAKSAAKKTTASKSARGQAGSARGKRSTGRADPSPGQPGPSAASQTAGQLRQAKRDADTAKDTGGWVKKNIVPLRLIKRGNASGHHLDTGPRRFLVAEFLVCMVLVTIGPLAKSREGESAGTWIKRASAIFGLFFVLGLITTGGRSAAKAAAGFGGIVAVAMLVTNRGAIVAIGESVSSPDTPDESGPAEDVPEQPDSTPDGPNQPPRPSPDGGPNPSRPGPDGPE